MHQFDRLLAIDGNNLEQGTLPQAVAMLLKVEHIVRLEILPVHRSVKSPTVPDAAAIPSVAAVSSSEPEDADHLPAPPDEILHDGGMLDYVLESVLLSDTFVQFLLHEPWRANCMCTLFVAPVFKLA